MMENGTPTLTIEFGPELGSRIEDRARRMGVSPAELVRRAFEAYDSAELSAGLEPRRTVYDVMNSAGLIGCLDDPGDTVTDLSTNPKHMEGFGCGTSGR